MRRIRFAFLGAFAALIAIANITATAWAGPPPADTASISLAITPSGGSFGDVTVGSSKSQTIKITNNGSAHIQFNRLTVSGAAFTLTDVPSSLTLGVHTSITFNVVFSPLSASNYMASIALITPPNVFVASIPLSGTGVSVGSKASVITPTSAPSANIVITPSASSFGSVTVGTSKSETIKITNNGSAHIQFNRFTISGPGFKLANVPSSLTLGAHTSIRFNIIFTPSSASTYSASIALITPPNVFVTSIPLSGAGVSSEAAVLQPADVASADIAITPSGASFGNVTVGTSNSQTIRITNNGSVHIQFNRLTVSGPGFRLANVPSDLAMGPHTYITFNVVFSPPSASKYSASVALVTPPNVFVASIPFSGAGVSASPSLSASSTTLSFGNVNLGTKASSFVTLTNKGNSNVTISGVGVEGLGFAESGIATGTVLTPGQSATLNAGFDPTVAGTTTGTISIASNAPGSPTISLSGTGVQSTASSVSLHWQAVPNILGYCVYRASTPGGPYTKLSSSVISSLQYVDLLVVPGLTYYYVVTAVGSGNAESSYSNQAEASVPISH